MVDQFESKTKNVDVVESEELQCEVDQKDPDSSNEEKHIGTVLSEKEHVDSPKENCDNEVCNADVLSKIDGFVQEVKNNVFEVKDDSSNGGNSSFGDVEIVSYEALCQDENSNTMTTPRKRERKSRSVEKRGEKRKRESVDARESGKRCRAAPQKYTGSDYDAPKRKRERKSSKPQLRKKSTGRRRKLEKDDSQVRAEDFVVEGFGEYTCSLCLKTFASPRSKILKHLRQIGRASCRERV